MMVRRLLSCTPGMIFAFTISTLVLASPYAGRAEAAVNGSDIAVEGAIVAESQDLLPDHVTLYAWPANEVLADIEIGEKFSLDPVASGTVGSDGTFAMQLDSMEELSRYASDEGDLNLYVSAIDGAANFSENINVDLDQLESSDESVIDVGEITESGEAALEADTSLDAPMNYLEKGCITTKVENMGSRFLPVGGLFSTNSKSTITFSYGKGTKSTISSAISIKDKYSEFKSSGTFGVSSDANLTFAPLVGKGSLLVKTSFGFSKYRTACAMYMNYYEDYVVRADSWNGGSQRANVPAPKATYCESYNNGDILVKDNSTQVRWTNGANLMGVDISVQTGWDTKGKLRVKIGSGGGKICGAGDYATKPKAYQIVVKP